MDADRCASCGAIIPEGTQVCISCMTGCVGCDWDDTYNCATCRREIRKMPTQNSDTCNSGNKPKPVEVGTKEAIEYFKEENKTYEHMLGDVAKIIIEYRINQLAIEALEEKHNREITDVAAVL